MFAKIYALAGKWEKKLTATKSMKKLNLKTKKTNIHD